MNVVLLLCGKIIIVNVLLITTVVVVKPVTPHVTNVMDGLGMIVIIVLKVSGNNKMKVITNLVDQLVHYTNTKILPLELVKTVLVNVPNVQDLVNIKVLKLNIHMLSMEDNVSNHVQLDIPPLTTSVEYVMKLVLLVMVKVLGNVNPVLKVYTYTKMKMEIIIVSQIVQMDNTKMKKKKNVNHVTLLVVNVLVHLTLNVMDVMNQDI